jgi:type II secretory pathway pseudopilin PulG
MGADSESNHGRYFLGAIMKNPAKKMKRANSSGFAMMELLVAMVIMTIGLVGLLGAMSVAMVATHGSEQDMIAKQIATQAMESIFTARNTSQIQWLQIQNAGAGTTPDGIFVNGPQPILGAGADGIIGTADDATPETMAGPDGIPGTADDIPLTPFTRSIAITAVGGTPGLRLITITVTYRVPPMNAQRTYVMTGFISQYR